MPSFAAQIDIHFPFTAHLTYRPSETAMLTIENLQKSFGRKTVAEGINLNIKGGEVLAVLGQSGCGKSTLLKMIAGLIAPDGGRVLLNGRDLTPLPPEARNVALMFQDYALLPHLNAWENAAFGLKLRGVPPARAKQQALDALAAVGLDYCTHQNVDALSGGEQQRVALARALVIEPDALLLDEAFSSLDAQLRPRIRQQTLHQVRERQMPAVLVTHDPEEAFGSAQHLALMHEGRIIQYGRPEDLFRRPASEQAARLLGLPNTYPHCHIPPAAVRVAETDAADAVVCPIIERTPLPELLKLTLAHPEYPLLTLHLDWPNAAAALSAETLAVRIDHGRVVNFAAA